MKTTPAPRGDAEPATKRTKTSAKSPTAMEATSRPVTKTKTTSKGSTRTKTANGSTVTTTESAPTTKYATNSTVTMATGVDNMDGDEETALVDAYTLRLSDDEQATAQQRSMFVKRLLTDGKSGSMTVANEYGLATVETPNGWRVVLPPTMWSAVFKEMHGSVWSGHLRGPHMYGRVAQLYWWPGLYREEVVLRFGVFRELLTDGAPELAGKTFYGGVEPERAHDGTMTESSQRASTTNGEQARRREQERQARYYNRKTRNKRQFQVGDLVWMHNPPRGKNATKFVHQWMGPPRIVEPAGYDNFVLTREDKTRKAETLIAHVSFHISYHYPEALLAQVARDIDEQLDYEDQRPTRDEPETASAVRSAKAPARRTTSDGGTKRMRVAVDDAVVHDATRGLVVERRRRRQRNGAGRLEGKRTVDKNTTSKGSDIHIFACTSEDDMTYLEKRFGSYTSYECNKFNRRLLKHISQTTPFDNVVFVCDNASNHAFIKEKSNQNYLREGQKRQSANFQQAPTMAEAMSQEGSRMNVRLDESVLQTYQQASVIRPMNTVRAYKSK
ncbi:Enzymatic Polyprotein [Phytophthora cinnamomi]|uniref:Enzymatic Polyprotein n=1 Tax=Phytophthora cinnamomi TaxID=4785 RepID=UPI00355A0AD9|nr:Enzymatic Polyprotein [Phytophthora cinnamomi]